MWSVLDFGTHKGRTLPWVLFHDPDWYFWAMEKAIFDNKPHLLPDATRIAFCARNIKIPKPDPENWEVRYISDRSGKFATFSVLPKDSHEDLDLHYVVRDHLDLAFPRSLKEYDKLGCKMMIRTLCHYFFGDDKVRLTKKRCEAFFDDQTKFLSRPDKALVSRAKTAA